MTMAKQSWRLLAAALALLGFVTMAWAETEVDPGAVSDGLKAIFKYGPGTHETADRLNSNTVTFITKLYNEEMHVLAPKSIRTLADLEGKTVAVDLPNGGTFVTSIIVFERLGIHPNFAYIEQRLAFEKLKKGEIDAMISVQGKPSKFNAGVKDENFHFVPIDYAKTLQTDYLPAQLTSDDYPNMIPKGERIDTIAVPAVLAAYSWAPNTERYRRLARFVDAFFNKIAT